MNKKQLTRIVQSFHDDAHKDLALQRLIDEYTLNQLLTGVEDPSLLLKIFDYLDEKMQGDIRKELL